jgi:hypothetical protein
MLASWCGGSATGDATLLIGRRNVEGGPRRDNLGHESSRAVAGASGTVLDGWQYDVYGEVNAVQTDERFDNDLSLTRIGRALEVVSFNAATGAIGAGGVPTCTAALPTSFRNLYANAGTDDACVPWNIFQPGGVTPQALRYLALSLGSAGTVTQQVLSANMTGDLARYGVMSPWAREGVKVNVGVEWREERSAFHPDAAEQSGDGAGFGPAAVPLRGEVGAREVFGELRAPLASDRSLASAVELSASYRFSRYPLGFDANTYAFGINWKPTRDLGVRASWSRAVRAPNVNELYYPTSVAGDGATDPCSGSMPQYSLAACERTGVTAAQYGNIVPNPAQTYNGLTGGNPRLHPEAATTITFGVGWSPSSVTGLRAQADVYYIAIPNVIQTIGADEILRQCLVIDILCGLIHRDSYGSLWLSPQGYVVDVLQNVGELSQRGIDVDLSYGRDVGRFGRVRASVVGSYLIDFVDATIQGVSSTSYDCTGYYGESCGQPTFRWRHTLRLAWEAPAGRVEVSLAWRYFDSVTLDALSANPNLAAPPGYTIGNGGISNTDARISSRSYIDMSAAIRLSTRMSVRLGINDVLDKDPPVIGNADSINGNTYPQIYDALGRYLFATLSVRL